MEDLSVAVLMSTYNGEKYLEEQIESILNQKYDNIHLYIRDDGSKDDTHKIIKKYSDNNSKVSFINEHSIKNIGVVRSFFSLLLTTKADLYMFSDQDDIWLPSKVSDSVRKIKQLDYINRPCVVYSNLKIVNEKLEGNDLLLDQHWQTLPYLLFTNNAYGCTMLFNNTLKDKIKFNSINYDRIFMHDWWLMLIAAEFGEIKYLSEPTILYRQHGDNQVGADSKSVYSRVLRLINQKIDRVKLKRSVNLAAEFLSEYREEMGENINFQYIKEYGELEFKSSFLNNIRLVLKLPPKSVHPMKELFYAYILTVYYRDFKKDDK